MHGGQLLLRSHERKSVKPLATLNQALGRQET